MNAKREFFSMAERRRFVGSMAAKRAEDLLAMLERVTEAMSNSDSIWIRTNPVITEARALIAQIKGE